MALDILDEVGWPVRLGFDGPDVSKVNREDGEGVERLHGSPALSPLLALAQLLVPQAQEEDERSAGSEDEARPVVWAHGEPQEGQHPAEEASTHEGGMTTRKRPQ
jgi:hypothetical protein